MIIQILSNMYDPGYLKKENHLFVSPFFSGANVAFRREIFDKIHLYDEACSTGEDQDIGIRLARANEDLYFQPQAVVRHKYSDSVRGFIKKWFKYGFGHSYLFKKHANFSLEIYITSKRKHQGLNYRCVLSMKKFFVKIGIFITPFLCLHACLVFAALCFFLKQWIVSGISGAIASCFILFIFSKDLNLQKPLRSMQFILLRYTANLALLLGGLFGGFKNRVFLLNGTLDMKG